MLKTYSRIKSMHFLFTCHSQILDWSPLGFQDNLNTVEIASQLRSHNFLKLCSFYLTITSHQSPASWQSIHWSLPYIYDGRSLRLGSWLLRKCEPFDSTFFHLHIYLTSTSFFTSLLLLSWCLVALGFALLLLGCYFGVRFRSVLCRWLCAVLSWLSLWPNFRSRS